PERNRNRRRHRAVESYRPGDRAGRRRIERCRGTLRLWRLLRCVAARNEEQRRAGEEEQRAYEDRAGRARCRACVMRTIWHCAGGATRAGGSHEVERTMKRRLVPTTAIVAVVLLLAAACQR